MYRSIDAWGPQRFKNKFKTIPSPFMLIRTSDYIRYLSKYQRNPLHQHESLCQTRDALRLLCDNESFRQLFLSCYHSSSSSFCFIIQVRLWNRQVALTRPCFWIYCFSRSQDWRSNLEFWTEFYNLTSFTFPPFCLSINTSKHDEVELYQTTSDTHLIKKFFLHCLYEVCCAI